VLDSEAHEGARAVEVVARLVHVQAAVGRRLRWLAGSGGGVRNNLALI
jgi:hypothetical protein